MLFQLTISIFCEISKNPSEIRILQILDERSVPRREEREKRKRLFEREGITELVRDQGSIQNVLQLPSLEVFMLRLPEF